MGQPAVFKIILIYLALSTFLYLATVNVVGNDTSDFLGNFIDTNRYEEGGNIVINESLEGTVPDGFSESGVGDTLSFIDALNAVQDFAILVGNIVLSPIGIFTGSGIPPMISLLIGLPLLLAGIFGIISFIRSGN